MTIEITVTEDTITVEAEEIEIESSTSTTVVEVGFPGGPGGAGIKGDPGPGVPPGGDIGQTIVKLSEEDYDTGWEDVAGGGGAIEDGDKGDITVSGPTWTINNGAVTLPKLQDIASARLLGRNTAGSGDAEELSVATAKTMLALDNVSNTTDANKPVSTATQAAIDALTKADIDLGNVDNTSDANKPISTATQEALNAKQAADADLTAIAGLDSSTAGAIASDGAGWIKKTYAQLKTAMSFVKGDVGLSQVDNTSDADKPVSTAQAAADALLIPLTEKGAANGVVPLGSDTKINSTYLPSIALTDTYTVASQAAMLALTAERGDVAIRTDVLKTFILSTDSPGTLADWKELPTPADLVSSVAGRTGVIVLTAADVDLADVDNTSDVDKPVSTAQQVAIDAKVADALSNGVTGVAPSQNAVFDALADKQPLDSDLTAIAALATTSFGRSLLALADAAGGRTAFNAEVAGAAAAAQAASQPLDSDLTAIALLTTTTFGRGFLDLADAAAARTKIALGNVDDTSDTTKNAATATLTNKTLDAASNTVTGLTEANMSSSADVLIRLIRVVLDGGGSAITTGAKKVYATVPYNCVITKARLLADVSGSIVVDIWKDTYVNFPPVVGDSITASAKPTLSSAQKSENTTLTGWTTSIAAGDILEVNVDSATTVTKVILDLFVRIV